MGVYCMKRSYKIITAIVLVILIFLVCPYLHVRGSDINGVENISETSSVTITKWTMFPEKGPMSEGKQKYYLDANQIEMLKSLISESNFRRKLPSWISNHDPDMYIIKVDFDNIDESLFMQSIGGDYIQVAGQFNYKFLKIKNPNWKKILEEIISLSSKTKINKIIKKGKDMKLNYLYNP